jgi:prepilin-type N-terminal cleavage/methylation domain-containing protein
MMRGTTLVELMVVLLVLGVMAGVSAFAVAGRRPPAEELPGRVLERARAAAIHSGRATSAPAAGGGVVRFLPDGRAIGLGVDPFTGEVLSAKR